MTDHGMIFNGAMVRALLDGGKTQTRRPLNPQPEVVLGSGKRIYADADWRKSWRQGGNDDLRYQPGDRLYVRETWTFRGAFSDVVEVGYRASSSRSHSEYVEQWPRARAVPGRGEWPRYPNYGPSIHMPRWASRLWLAVTDVRVQRLQDITEGDCIAEGIDQYATAHFGSAVKAYAALWNSIYGGEDSDLGWAANPWVCAVSFEVHQGNIDLARPAEQAAGNG